MGAFHFVHFLKTPTSFRPIVNLTNCRVTKILVAFFPHLWLKKDSLEVLTCPASEILFRSSLFLGWQPILLEAHRRVDTRDFVFAFLFAFCLTGSNDFESSLVHNLYLNDSAFAFSGRDLVISLGEHVLPISDPLAWVWVSDNDKCSEEHLLKKLIKSPRTYHAPVSNNYILLFKCPGTPSVSSMGGCQGGIIKEAAI